MYVPPHFDEPRMDVLHDLMRARPLATLVTLSCGGLDANHIPLHLDAAASPLGTLRGHVARANPVWRDVPAGSDVLAIFHGPDAYVTPAWYPAKRETGKVVPTWNYAVAHAHGALRVIDDVAWLRAHLEALTARQEQPLPEPWQLFDAPREFTDRLIEAVVGIEIVVTRLAGKWKLSQNQNASNRAGVAAGLRDRGMPGDLEMADLIEAGTKQG